MLRIDALAERDARCVARVGTRIVEPRRARIARGQRERRRDQRGAQPHAQPTRMQDIMPLA